MDSSSEVRPAKGLNGLQTLEEEMEREEFVWSTGFGGLDKCLHGGWRRGRVINIIGDRGVGASLVLSCVLQSLISSQTFKAFYVGPSSSFPASLCFDILQRRFPVSFQPSPTPDDEAIYNFAARVLDRVEVAGWDARVVLQEKQDIHWVLVDVDAKEVNLPELVEFILMCRRKGVITFVRFLLTAHVSSIIIIAAPIPGPPSAGRP
ncbi:hypothetical protein BT69DRAFT_1333585 [Atractiella rhizophila]|nr:hypothetical protein BT69DRAFT_1333585 [Atractiella rhizophila]